MRKMMRNNSLRNITATPYGALLVALTEAYVKHWEGSRVFKFVSQFLFCLSFSVMSSIS